MQQHGKLCNFLSGVNWCRFICSYPKNSDANRQTSNVSRTLVGNDIVEHSDVAGASPVGAAPTTS